MDSFLKTLFIGIVLLMSPTIGLKAQKGQGHGHYHHKGYNNKTVIMVKGNPYQKYHPHYYHRRVFHPVWATPIGFHRRWVFFPHYNFYWDNYNSVYVYWGGAAWIKTPTPPPTIINVNISEEKKYELKDADDSVDDVYKSNENHKKEYPES